MLLRPVHILALAAALVIVAALAARPVLERAYLSRAGDGAEATLQIAVEGLNGALRRYEPLPALIADRPILKELLRDPTNAGLLPYVNEQLRQTALGLDASDVYVLDPTGLAVAASNYRKDATFIGRNFLFRPYFTEALSGGLGRFHALGTTSGERGIFFSAPVLDGVRVVGVVAVKFTVESFEDSWRASGQEVFVSDRNGIVFMSSRPDWLFRTMAPVAPDVADFVAATRQFPLARMEPLAPEISDLDGPNRYWTIAGEHFVGQSQSVRGHDFTIHVLVDATPAARQAWSVIGVAALGLAIVGLIVTVILMRRASILERLETQRAAAELLEARVTERTEDLRREVEERTGAETRLRNTQKELIQAGKLAALGHMSAALSHEINQPLAAMKSYADNAATFLERDRPHDAQENIGRISELADRMAAISSNLRNFARRPQENIGPIPAEAVIDDALGLMEAQLRKAGARVTFHRPEAPVWVLGGRLRLQQVIVNLLSNALEEVETAPAITITLSGGPEVARIAIRDNGPGLDQTFADQMFDPFFTTKAPGKGLGLGLSISFNIVEDFGGHLSARNHEAGGAEFIVDLKAAEAPDMAAE